MKMIALPIAGIVTILSLSACSSSGVGGEEVEGCMEDGTFRSGCETTIEYKGRPLDCVTWAGSNGEVGLSCDFVAYHGRN